MCLYDAPETIIKLKYYFCDFLLFLGRSHIYTDSVRSAFDCHRATMVTFFVFASANISEKQTKSEFISQTLFIFHSVGVYGCELYGSIWKRVKCCDALSLCVCTFFCRFNNLQLYRRSSANELHIVNIAGGKRVLCTIVPRTSRSYEFFCRLHVSQPRIHICVCINGSLELSLFLGGTTLMVCSQSKLKTDYYFISYKKTNKNT